MSVQIDWTAERVIIASNDDERPKLIMQNVAIEGFCCQNHKKLHRRQSTTLNLGTGQI